MKKLLSFVLALIVVLSVGIFTSCDLTSSGTDTKKEQKKDEEIKEVVDYPDYSKYTDYFDYYGYSSASDGREYLDGTCVKEHGSSLNVDQYKLYKDCGFTIFYPQSVLSISADSPKSDLAKLTTELTKLKTAGITKTIVFDERLAALSISGTTGLVGEGRPYANEAKLDEKIEKLISGYATLEGVYGVVLADEPKWERRESYAQVYKSLKRVCTAKGYNLHIQYNLNPCTLSQYTYDNYFPEVPGTETYTDANCYIRYKKYITDFLDLMEPDYVQYDDYPLRNGYVKKYYFQNLQFVAEEARKRGIDFYLVTQSFDMKTNNVQSMRGSLSKEEATWLNNTLLGYGIKQISYFTYFTRAENFSNGESFLDNGSAFVSLDGTPTPFYTIMKGIMANNQKFAPTIKQFDYQGSKSIKATNATINDDYIKLIDNSYTFKSLKSANVDSETALLTELYDSENKNYIVMAMNIIDPALKDKTYQEKITLEFDSTLYTHALVYRDGVMTKATLTAGKIEITAKPGEASFVLPYKK